MKRFEIEKIKPSYITVMSGMSGYFAALISWYPDSDDESIENGMWDVNNTGVGRYRKYAQAEMEAKSWAKDEQIEYRQELVNETLNKRIK